MTAEETDLFEPGFLEKTERYVRNEIAYNLLPGSPFFGGKFKEKDWLGTKIRLSWGENLNRYMQHRFFPREHPNDKVYAELNHLNLLNPPGPLMTKTLEGVPMSDDLQQLYNQTYGSTVGNKETAFLNIKKKIVITPDTTQTKIIKSGPLAGQAVSVKGKQATIDMSTILAKHVEGKTPIEAFRSLMNDPKYIALKKNKSTTTVQEIVNKEIKEVQKELPYVLMQELKNYYGQLTINQLNLSEEGSAVKWRERRDLYSATRQQKRTDDSSAAAKILSGIK